MQRYASRPHCHDLPRRRVSSPRHRPFALYDGWPFNSTAIRPVLDRDGTVALQMLAVAVSWQMYDLTRNPLDLGLVGLVQFLPAALLVLVAGHVADRYDRRMIVRTCNLICGLAAVTLAFGTASGVMTRESLLAIVFVIGACRAFEQTTLTTLLPGIVTVAMLPRATAAAASATQVAVIAGPAVGGLIYAVNPVLVYALCCTLYICAGLSDRHGGGGAHRGVARADQPDGAVRRLLLYPAQPDHPRRHHARPVRGDPRRRVRAAAGVRPRRVRRRAVGARPAARVAGRRRADCRASC